MTNHYRHHRVVRRLKQPTATSYYNDIKNSICDTFMEQPLLSLGLTLLFFFLLIKCLFCHK